MMSAILDILDCVSERGEIGVEELMKRLSHWRSNTLRRHLIELRARGYVTIKQVDGREIVCKGAKLR